MPIQTQIEKRFTKDVLKKIIHTHRWAILLGLIIPACIFLFSIFQSGSVFGSWPSVLTQAYEQTLFFGWAGMYLFAMLFVIYPELNDLKGAKKNVLARWMNLYGAGVLGIVLGVFLWLFTKSYALFAVPVFLGTIFQILGWAGALRGFFKMLKKKKRFSAFDQLIAIGLIPFTFALLALLFAYLSLFIAGDVHFSLGFRVGFRFLPITGIGLILIAMIIRMSPEMLNWRPLDEQKLRNIYAYILVATVVLASGYTWFHTTYQQPGTFLYAIGALGIVGGVFWLFSSLDLWTVKILKGEVQDHIPFLYTSLIWLVITMLGLLGYASWEIIRVQSLSLLWVNIFLYSFFLGFIINGVLGILVYLNNQIEGVVSRSSALTTAVFGILFWVLLLRVLILPLMLIYGWPGYETFQWTLDGILFIAVFSLTFSLLLTLTKGRKK